MLLVDGKGPAWGKKGPKDAGGGIPKGRSLSGYQSEFEEIPETKRVN